ncbi:DEKNAAC102785 [Brettanomyces naardenensis]|uniref:mannose-1-phosphate guanylyltransferase n=1 Tax=Brettanomyces naardenensis TaxID=13370 RepID=A0A448YKX2_BRENA|nr:DEKNAAC102785 [Brettanomyces naardenensis]
MTTTKAIVMVGGGSRGTRFRPLALDQAKILFPIAGKPLLAHTVDSILEIDSIKEIILIGFYEPSVFTEFISEFDARMRYSKRRCSMRYLKEFKALGTAGGLYYFRNEIMEGSPDSFLVIHGDIVCSFPLQKMVEFYDQKAKDNKGKKLDAVLMGVKLQNYDLFLALNDRDQSSFGTIISDEKTGKVVHYVEKPETKMSETINGGIYLFNDKLFHRLSHAKITKITTATENAEFVDEDVISMEEDILENLPEFRLTYVYPYTGFWTAVKTPSDAMYANELYLNELYNKQRDTKSLTPSAPLHHRTPTVDQIVLEKPSSHIIPPVYIHPTSKIDESMGTKIGPYVSIGAGSVVGAGTRISNSIILDKSVIGPNSLVTNSIVSYRCKVGSWTRVEGTGINIKNAKQAQNGPSKPEEQRETRVIGIKDSGNISILGSGTSVSDDAYILNSFILPNKSIKHDMRYEIIM